MEYSIIGQEGETLFEAMQKAGVPVESPCGGNGTCGKCKVRVISADFDPEPAGVPGSDYRLVLSCRTRFKRNGQAFVDIIDNQLHIVDNFDLPIPEGEPALERRTVALPKPELKKADSELFRLENALGTRFDDSFEAVETLSTLLKTGNRSVAALIQHGTGHSIHADITPGISGTLLSAAVDIGTTTVAVRVLDAETGAVLTSGAEANVQRWAGADVISRIGVAENSTSFERMRDGIRGQIERMIVGLAESAGHDASAVRRIVIAGNPTMLHFLAGVDPAGIARAPFVPVFTSSFDIPAPLIASARRPFNKACRIILIPGISAYVGADLVAGALACGLDKKNEDVEPALLLDLGTNGEIMLFVRGRVWCCSAAAGPAFEGASIEFGCPSIPGAIDHVSVVGSEIKISVLGGGKATGICGSGILDSVACLLPMDAIDVTGRINPSAEGLKPECFTVFKGKPAIVLDKASGVVLTQDDIRQVQLAKAAIAAGAGILMQEAGIHPSDVRRIFLAGGFGSKLDPRSALAIGLLHSDFSGRIEAVGNSSLAGAAIVALRKGAIDACIDLTRRCSAIELSGRPDFVERFSEAMLFPEKGSATKVKAI